MSKIDSIQKYAPLYLKGKSENFIRAFEGKTVDKQYSAVMTWRSRQKRKQQSVQTVTLTPEAIVSSIKGVGDMINSLPEKLKENQISEIESAVKSLMDFLTGYKDVVRREEIVRLERQREEISQRLKELKSGIEPSLFD